MTTTVQKILDAMTNIAITRCKTTFLFSLLVLLFFSLCGPAMISLLNNVNIYCLEVRPLQHGSKQFYGLIIDL